MNVPHIEGCGPKVSASLIVALESELGCCLPADYKSFLQRCNGGIPVSQYFPVEGRDEEIWIDYVLQVDEHGAGAGGIADGPGAYKTIAFAQAKFGMKSGPRGLGFGNIIPEGTLVVGIVGRDNPLLLYYKGVRCGQVYWKYLQDLPFPPSNRWENERELGLHFIAMSFTDFIGMLRGDPSMRQSESITAVPKTRKVGQSRGKKRRK